MIDEISGIVRALIVLPQLLIVQGQSICIQLRLTKILTKMEISFPKCKNIQPLPAARWFLQENLKQQRLIELITPQIPTHFFDRRNLPVWLIILFMNVSHLFSVVVLYEQGVSVGCTVWQCGSCHHRVDRGEFTVLSNVHNLSKQQN